jgi:hypothetical protein
MELTSAQHHQHQNQNQWQGRPRRQWPRRLGIALQHLRHGGARCGAEPSATGPVRAAAAPSSGTAASLLDEPILVDSVVQQFDLEKFERDGFWVWESVLNERCVAELSAACERVQKLNDDWISFDWASLDWASLREASTPLAEPVAAGGQTLDYMNPPGWTAEDIAYGRGQTHAMPARDSPFAKHGYRGPSWDHPRVPVLQGYPPEMFPAGMDDTIMKCMIHPQMLTVHQQMIGAENPFVGAVFLSKPIVSQDRLGTSIRNAERFEAFLQARLSGLITTRF